MESTEQINLMTQIKKLSVELALYQDSNQNKNAIEGYEHINSDFESLMDQLQNVSDKYQLFIPVKKSLASSLFDVGDIEYHRTVALNNIEEVMQCWDGKDYEVTQDDSYPKTIDSIQNFINKLDTGIATTWDIWVKSLIVSFQASDSLLGSIANIPGQQQLVEQYRNKNSRFNSTCKCNADNLRDYNSLIKLHQEMLSLKSQMDFNYPESVKVFFAKLEESIHDTIPLQYVTSEVLEWLIENGELQNFGIKRNYF